jgi:uncharacterized membrane protein YvlD (DUF360 family)
MLARLSQNGPRIVGSWLITAGGLLVLNAVLRGFHVDGPTAALAAAALIGLANALVWPLLIRIALPFTVLTLGLGALVLNGAIVLAVAAIDSGIHVDDLATGIAVAIGLTIINTLVTALLAIDDEDFFYRYVVKRQARRSEGFTESDVPGVYFIEIDGLAHDVLRRAIRDGNSPTLAKWVHEGSHDLIRWETDWSSQTGACQAGLLHGDNHDMPAFRWWEKDRGAAIVTNHPRDAAELERRHSNGRGLLHADGASRANILSGDAVHSLLTMSTVLDRNRPGRLGADYYGYFANPYNALRSLMLSIGEIAAERYHATIQKRRDVLPRIPRSRTYALVRAWATVIQRDLQVSAVIADLYAGRPVGYTTFLAYDEVAHHSGVERPDALSTLRRVDRQIARIERAAADAPRPYRFVVLADHGQSQGATFEQRFGETLEDVVRSASGAADVEASGGGNDEAAGFLKASVVEAGRDQGVLGRAADAAARGTSEEDETEEDDHVPDLSVMASGCLGLVSFPREEGRVTLERLEVLHPALVPALRAHEGIGFVLVRSERDGAVVLGADGVNYLDQGRVEGGDPLAPFGPNAARHVKRTDGFPHCPDIVLNSTFWEESDEVAAFEGLVGSHGGMGGEQSYPFTLFPADWRHPEEEVVGAEHMHRVMRGWLADLGQSAYAEPGEPAPAAAAATTAP